MRRALLLAVVALLAVGSVGVVSADIPLADIGADHGLDERGAVEAFDRTGSATGEVDRYDVDLTIATDRESVGAGDAAVTNIRNRFLRIEYHESVEREVRILIPREYRTPYTGETQSLTSDHTIHLEPARSGEYLAVETVVDGESDIVVPLSVDHAISYSLLERMDQRVQTWAGFSPLDRDDDWHYIDADAWENETLYLNQSAEDVVVQFDATPARSDETWLNVPRGETVGSGVYILDVEGENTTIISKASEPPQIRYRSDSLIASQVRGWISEAQEIPGNVRDNLAEWLPW